MAQTVRVFWQYLLYVPCSPLSWGPLDTGTCVAMAGGSARPLGLVTYDVFMWAGQQV